MHPEPPRTPRPMTVRAEAFLIPEEKVSAKELNRIRKIRKEMLAGKEKSLKGVFAE